MRNAASYTPVAGITQPINLLYNDGVYEIINISPFTLTINGVGGGIEVESGAKVLYPNTQGGTLLQIVPNYTLTLLADGSIQTIDDAPFTLESRFTAFFYDTLVIVNEYFPNEIDTSSYPTSIMNTSFPAIPNPLVKSTVYSSNTSASFTMMPPAAGRFSQIVNATQNAYLTGFDFFGPAHASILTHIITISNVLTPVSSPTPYTMTFVVSSTTSGGPQLQIRFPTPLINRGPRYGIGFAVNTLDPASTYGINTYGFYQ